MTVARYDEKCVWFYPIKNEEILWMNNIDYYCIVTPLLSIDNSQKKQGSVVLWMSEIQDA